MKKQHLFLIAGIVASITFIGYLSETNPKSLFGVTLNIWFHRLAWLIIAFGFFGTYFRMKKQENSSK